MAVFSSDMHARRERALKEDTSLNSMIVLNTSKTLTFRLIFFPESYFC